MRRLALVLCFALGCSGASEPAAHTAADSHYREPPATQTVLRGETLLSSGKHAEAAKAFQQAIVENPEDARAWLDLGLAQEGLGRAKAAEKSYRKATELEPGFAEAYNNLGVLVRESGALNDAIHILERAVRLKPSLADAQLNLAMAYEDAGQSEQAEEAYLRAIELAPRDAVARINLGFLYLTLGRHQDARRAFRAARALARGDAGLLISIGSGLRRAQAPGDAVAVLNEALEVGEPSATLLGELALAHYANGDHKKAESLMRDALRKRASDPGLRYAYANILLKNGKRLQAKAQLMHIVKNHPKSRFAERARARLEEI